MGKTTGIEWTDRTWNAWQGCKKVSPGCKNCYMFREKKRWGQDPEKIHRSSNKTFFSPLSWKKPAMVFTCSWSDFFIEEADPWRDDAWQVIRVTPHLTYQILTKRPERIIHCLPDDWPLPNVWLGVTGENQEMADKRWADLTQANYHPPKVWFLSVEPMLGPVRFNDDWLILQPNWVICGGESGPGYRGMLEAWANELRQDCYRYKVPFFMKQMAGINPKKIPIPDFLNIKEYPK